MSEKCPLCEDKIFETISGLRRHLTTIHNIKHEEHRNYIKKVADKEDKIKIEEEREKDRSFNYEKLLFLTKDIPSDLDCHKEKEKVNAKTRKRILERDNYTCYLCNRNKYCLVHHRIPNGDASDENLFSLCEQCHKIVHIILWLDKKWMFQSYNKNW